MMNGRIARNIERPRPLRSNSATESGSKSGGDVDGVHQLLLNISCKLDRSDFGGALPEAIAVLNKALKIHGAKLEKTVGSGLNPAMGSLMSSVRHEKLDMASKLYILEIIELRKNKWVLDGTLAEYYRQKLASLESKSLSRLNASACEFEPKSASSPRVPNLRHSASVDSGAAAAGDAPMTIKVGGETIRIACNNEEMAKTCKKALDVYFAEKSSMSTNTDNDDSAAEDADASKSSSPLITYGRDKLLELATTRHSATAHCGVLEAFAAFPMLKRRPDSVAQLPYDWAATFTDEAAALAVLNEDNFNNNNSSSFKTGPPAATGGSPKKNFLDVLRPNAPRRVWDDNVGEWVEAETRG